VYFGNEESSKSFVGDGVHIHYKDGTDVFVCRHDPLYEKLGGGAAAETQRRKFEIEGKASREGRRKARNEATRKRRYEEAYQAFLIDRKNGQHWGSVDGMLYVLGIDL